MKLQKMLQTVALGAVLALGAAAAPATAQDQSVLNISLSGDIKEFDPIWTTAYPVRNAAYMVWDTLFATDENFEIQPQMVGDWSVSDDGTLYTFTLRDGLLWHDGTPVTAADCIASIQRWGVKDTVGRLLLERVSAFEALDENTFTLKLNQPWGYVLQALGKPGSTVPFMMPERMAKTDPGTAITEYVGSGPFRLVEDEWIRGSVMVFEKFDDYVPRSEPPSSLAGGKVAKVDRIEARYIPDTVTAVNALLAGEIDWRELIPADLLDIVLADDSVETYVFDPIGGNAQIVLNHSQKPFDDKKVRQAVLYAVDQAEFHQAHMGDRKELYEECGAVFACGTPFESDVMAEAVIRKDEEKAKKLLAESSYNDEPIVIMLPTDIKMNADMSYVLAEALKRVGFKVDLQLTEWASVASRRASDAPVSEGGWHIFVTGWSGGDLMNPLTNVYVTGACEKAWFGWPCIPELQELMAKYAVATDPAEQKALTEEIQRVTIDEVVFVTLGKLNLINGRRASTEGWLTAPVPLFWNVEKSN